MSITFEIDNFTESLFSESLKLFQCFGVFKFYKKTKVLKEVKRGDIVRSRLVKRNQIRAMWMSFSVAYELLFKAILSKHQALDLSRKNVSNKYDSISSKKGLESIAKVYFFAKHALVKFKNDTFMQDQIRNNKISHLYDIDTGTLGKKNLSRLKKLENNGIITPSEREILKYSSQLLADLRRNIDLHTFFGTTVTKDINGDLSLVYLPAINLMIDIYERI